MASLKFNRAMLNDSLTDKNESPVVKAIVETCDRFTTNRRMMTGKTYTSHENMTPYIGKTIDLAPIPQNSPYVLDMEFKGKGFDNHDNGKKKNASISIDESLEVHMYRKFCAKYGLTLTEEMLDDFPVCKSWSVSENSNNFEYPDNYI